MQYDVAIVGAGIPGLYAARELAKAGYKVGLFERLKAPGEPNYSTAWVSDETISDFDLPRESIATDIYSHILSNFDIEVIKETKKLQAYVLDFKKTKILLADQAQFYSAAIFYGTKINDINFDARKNKFISIQDDRGHDIYADLFIDASGPSFALFSKTGKKIKKGSPALGIEYIIKDKNNSFQKYAHSIAIFFSNNYTPFGYAWICGNGENLYKIGICEANFSPHRNLPDLKTRLDIFLSKFYTNSTYEIIETGGSLRYVNSQFSNKAFANLIGIGDCIGAINPLLGAGIGSGLVSADYAVQSIKESIKLKNNPAYLFNMKWVKYLGYKWYSTSLIKSALYGRNDKRNQVFISKLLNFIENKLTADDLLKLGYDFEVSHLLSRFVKNYKLLVSFIASIK